MGHDGETRGGFATYQFGATSGRRRPSWWPPLAEGRDVEHRPPAEDAGRFLTPAWRSVAEIVCQVRDRNPALLRAFDDNDKVLEDKESRAASGSTSSATRRRLQQRAQRDRAVPDLQRLPPRPPRGQISERDPTRELHVGARTPPAPHIRRFWRHRRQVPGLTASWSSYGTQHARRRPLDPRSERGAHGPSSARTCRRQATRQQADDGSDCKTGIAIHYGRGPPARFIADDETVQIDRNCTALGQPGGWHGRPPPRRRWTSDEADTPAPAVLRREESGVRPST